MSFPPCHGIAAASRCKWNTKHPLLTSIRDADEEPWYFVSCWLRYLDIVRDARIIKDDVGSVQIELFSLPPNVAFSTPQNVFGEKVNAVEIFLGYGNK